MLALVDGMPKILNLKQIMNRALNTRKMLLPGGLNMTE